MRQAQVNKILGWFSFFKKIRETDLGITRSSMGVGTDGLSFQT